MLKASPILLLTIFCLHCFMLASLSLCQEGKNKGISFILQVPQLFGQEFQHKANWMTLQEHRDLCQMFILKTTAISFPCQFWESVQFYFLFIIELQGVVLKQRNNFTFNIHLSPSSPSILIIFPSSFPVVFYTCSVNSPLFISSSSSMDSTTLGGSWSV